MSVTLRFQSSGAVPGDGQPIVMRGPTLTIGRGPDNDVVLPDPDRQISKTHCVIEDHNGNIIVVDFSTNGTFLNYGKAALGQIATPINDGDVLIVGPYELVVDIASANASNDDPLAPLGDDPASFGDAGHAPDPYKLIDDAAPGGDFLDDLLGGAAPAGPGQFRKPHEEEPDLLPPLGEDDLLGPAPEQPTGPTVGDHSSAASDSFRPAQPGGSEAVIPDDWDDFLEPTPDPAPRAPQAPLPEGSDIFSHGPSTDPTKGDDLPGPPPAAPSPSIADGDGPGAPPSAPADPLDPFAAEPDEVPAAENAGAAPPGPPEQAVTAPPAGSAEVPPAAPPAVSSDAARAFLEAVGAADLAITDAELPETMARLGRTLNSMITGLREILMTRTSIKSEFRIEQTMISAGGNNPLKFSVSPEQAIEAIVKPTARGYLPAETAAAQALDDIKAHEIAMVTGMEAALKGVLQRLDPQTLTSKIEARAGLGGLLKNRKAQYWETYETMYAEISDAAENDFQELFAREFARAYREQLARLKE